MLLTSVGEEVDLDAILSLASIVRIVSDSVIAIVCDPDVVARVCTTARS